MRRHSAFLILLILGIVCLGALAPSASAQGDSTIRVYLKRLGVGDTIHVRTQGEYALDDGTMYFESGSEFAVSARDGRLVIYLDRAAVMLGGKLTLRRATEAESGLYLEGAPGLYEGDLQLDIVEEGIRPILFIDVERYLLGVVPYEMGDSFPLEALKAQAIAARTYALRKRNLKEPYDLEDTTFDQAFRGRSASSPRSEQAVRETEGECGFYKGKLAQCYYSASNGGQIELGQNIWPREERDAYGYMEQKDDPYDLENDASVVRRYTVSKKPGKNGVGEALHSALVSALAEQLSAFGHQAEDDLVRIDRIRSIEAVEPRFPGDSRVMSALRFTLSLSVRDCRYRAPKTEETQTEAKPTATPAYSPFQKLKEEFVVELPIFPLAEQVMSLSINAAQNELVTVVDIGSAFMIESRRFGHGVGMSQRGAEQMARRYGKNDREILTFYYPKMEIRRVELAESPRRTPNPAFRETPSPMATPTPRPTLMPVTTEKLPKGAYLAVVFGAAENSWVNLRESPSRSASVVRQLYNDQPLIVLKVRKDGWAKVKTDVAEGYVFSDYLQTLEKTH